MRFIALSLFTVLAASPALAAYNYTCYPPKGADVSDAISFTINGKWASFSGSQLRLDPTYKPRSNKDYVRFSGYRGELNNDGYSVDILTHKDMLAGKYRGSLKVVARGEGYFNDFYSCYRKR